MAPQISRDACGTKLGYPAGALLIHWILTGCISPALMAGASGMHNFRHGLSTDYECADEG